MKAISECLLVGSGLVVTTTLDELGGSSPLEFQVIDGKLVYGNEIIEIPVSKAIMDHLFSRADNKIYFYGGKDQLAREYIGETVLTKEMLIYAKGILWAIQPKDAVKAASSSPLAPPDSKYQGLKLPPDVKEAA